MDVLSFFYSIMFPKPPNLNRKIFGIGLLTATIFFTFGHTIISPSVVSASDRVHKDEVPHAPDSEDHSPCPTEMHQTISNRPTSDDDQNSISAVVYSPVALHSSNTCFDNHSISTHFLSKEKIPPRLPLQQKTNLLI